MGKTLLIGVILLTVIFAAITITVQRRTAKVPEMLSQNLAEQRAANLGAYALLYGMNQIDKGAIPRSKIPFGGGFYTKNYTDFYALEGNINSLRYAALDATKDTIKIIANVTCIVGADTVHHESEAAADFSGEAIEGLVGYWKMDEDSWDGTVDEVIDISGYDNHGIGEPTNGTYNGPTTIAAGKYDRAGEFDGIDDYVDCGNDSSLDITDAITVEAWLKPLPNPFELLDDFEDRGNETWEEIFEGGSEVWNETFEYRGDEIFEEDFEDGDIDGWTTGGHDKWFATSGKHHGGNWSAKSGDIGDSQYSDIYKDITGPATLTFWWKVSSRSGSYQDYLKFYVDGKQIWAICGDKDWNKKVYSVEKGTHTIKWRYSKDLYATSGSDCGWIDDISITNIGLGEGWSTNGHRNWYVTDIYTPHGGNWSAKSGDIGDSQYSDIYRTITGPATITFWWKVSSRSGSYQDYLKFYVDGKQIWAICGDPGWQRKMYSVEQGTHTIKWRYSKDLYATSGYDSGWIDDISITDIGLGEGWSTSGHRNWYFTDQYPAHSGIWCAKSGDIGDSQYTDLQRTVKGPATITFWWKVSSRSGSYQDYLKFYVDDKQIWAICGDKDWQKKVYSVQEGTHTIKWRYSKDLYATSGLDSGWIDDISITDKGLEGWKTNGHRNWYVSDLYPAHSGTWCAKSGDIGDSQYSDIYRTITGPATITFWWKVSSRSGSYQDYLKFYVDGKQIWAICGKKDWDKKVYSVQEGTHTIKWRYSKDLYATSGYDSGWIDDISITGRGLSAGLIKVDAYGIGANTTGKGGMTAGWTTGGHRNWYLTNLYPAHSGTWCAKSGDIGNSQYTDLYRTVKGPATITFWWKVSSRSGSYQDYLKFYVDGKQIWKICGNKNWNKKVYSVQEGTHTIKWRYSKDLYASSGLDSGWIDDISITDIGLGEGWSTHGHRNWYSTELYPAHSSPWCAKSGDIGDSQYTDLYRTVIGPATITFWWKVSSRSGSYQDYLKFYVDGKQIWAICGNKDWHKKVYSVQEGTHTIKWRYSKDLYATSGYDSGWIDDISITDEGLGKGWTTSGHRNWYVTDRYKPHGGSWCAKSGDIGDSQYTDLQRTVKGPTTISFWWKVSSRSGSYQDYLKFYVDGKQIWKICGNKNWQKKSYPIPAGEHTIKWRYSKDLYATSHDDSGWIDDITGGFSDNFEDRGTEVWKEVFTERGSGIFKDDFEEGGVPPDTLSAFAMINGNTISVDISSGGWTHIALTYDKDAGANNQRLYINGTRVDSTTLTEPININANNLLFGKFYMGAVDEVAIFDRALSVDEIMKIYHFGLAHKIIYWIE